MKKLLTLAALLGAASLSFGQGIVNFTQNTQVITTNNAGTTGKITGAGNYYFALFQGPTTLSSVTPSLAGFTFSGNYGTNTTAGRFNGNTTADPGVVITGYQPGDSADFAIIGWSANLGHDVNTVLAWWANGNPLQGTGADAGMNGYFGQSALINVLVGGGAISVPQIMGTGPGLAPGFALNYYTVPEPGTLALAGLGAAAMLIFRRRK